MTSFHPHLSAAEVHSHLRRSLEELRQAERNAVLWFAEVWQRKLYRDLGYGSVQQYAALALGFSRSKTCQFLRLARSLESLPVLRESLERGEVSWTKAREVVKVATPKTEAAWVETARQTGRRELETRVAVARGKAKAARTGNRAQVALAIAGDGDGGEPRGGRRSPEEVPADVHIRFSPEQYAHYEALLEKLRKMGVSGSREELLLAGLQTLAACTPARTDGGVPGKVDRPKAGPARPQDRPAGRGGTARMGRAAGPHPEDPTPTAGRSGRSAPSTRVHTAPNPEGPTPSTRVNRVPLYQVHIHLCERCTQGEAITSRGPKLLAPEALRAILCDTRVHKPGERNRATIPPSVRRAVLTRDRHRCRGAGCGSARFLSVHHRVPRAAGGTNDPDNLITLCGSCHRAVHAHDHAGEVPLRAAG